MGPSHKANWDRLCQFVGKVMKEKSVPGVSVGILHEGETAAAGFGVTNVYRHSNHAVDGNGQAGTGRYDADVSTGF